MLRSKNADYKNVRDRQENSTATIQQLISMDMELGKRMSEVICRAWNELDASLFESILSDDFEYISIWVLETMKGKNRYIDYITGKFESIRKENNPVSAEIIFQERIDKYVVVLNQGGNLAALEPTIEDDMLKSLWMRPVDMTLPAVFMSKKPKRSIVKKEETEYEKFSKLFHEALMEKDFSCVDWFLADDVVQILYDNKEISGKKNVISYWLDWLERWNEPAVNTNYNIKLCKYYDREVLSIEPRGKRILYQMARIEEGKAKQLILCPNPLQSPMIRYWDLDHSPLLFKAQTVMPHRMGKDLEPRLYRIPCMRCGCKSENLQWYEYSHEAGPLGYKGELSVCTNCMEAVEFFPTILLRYK